VVQLEQAYACLNCGAAFEPTCHITRQKYCSEACRFRYNNAKRDIRKKTSKDAQEQGLNYCKYCGGAVTQPEKGAPRAYCSELCRRAWWEEQNAIIEAQPRPEKIPKQKKKRGPPLPMSTEGEPSGPCPQCGCDVYQRPKMKRRVFCSDKCRFKWWAANRSIFNRKTFYICTCLHCGRAFESYGAKHRKYCDKDCAWAARSKHPKDAPPAMYAIAVRQDWTSEDWRLRLQKISYASQEKQDRRIVLVCGTTKLRIENLSAIIRYRLEEDPYGGDLYVFCDNSRKRVGLLQWDGDTFRFGSRKLQWGTYPWADFSLGQSFELSEEELGLLLGYAPWKKYAKHMIQKAENT
jgi:endogenous inhibitor of DNA gyrase (YacG/DUF329 family)